MLHNGLICFNFLLFTLINLYYYEVKLSNIILKKKNKNKMLNI